MFLNNRSSLDVFCYVVGPIAVTLLVKHYKDSTNFSREIEHCSPDPVNKSCSRVFFSAEEFCSIVDCWFVVQDFVKSVRLVLLGNDCIVFCTKMVLDM